MRIKQIKQIREWINKKQTTKVIITKPAKSNSTAILTSTHTEEAEHCPTCKIGYLHLIGEIFSERERRRFAEIN